MFALGYALDPGSHCDTQSLSEDTEYQSWQGLLLLDHFTDAGTEAQKCQMIYSGSQTSGK